jgi:serine protease Do
VRYAYLGVETRPVWPELAHFLGLPDTPGVLVGDIREGSPAEAARLHGGYFDVSFQGSRLIAGGDMIISIGRQKLRPNEKLVTVLERFRPGQAVEVGFVRDGREQSLRIELGERPLIKENALGF